MAITSEEIHNQSFTVDRKGYDVDEVDVFLEHVAAEIDGLNAEIEELTAQLHAQASYEEEPMDMDAAFAEPPMAQPEEDRDAESAQALSADEKDERIAELERKLAEQENDASLLRTRCYRAAFHEVIDAANSEAKRIKSDAGQTPCIIDRANAEGR
ncbi:MAG: DivIVA domain-containing protein [Eggerthellaceae bacterium]